MYLELRTWKTSWFGAEPAIGVRAFGGKGVPPADIFGVATPHGQEPPTASSHRTLSPWADEISLGRNALSKVMNSPPRL